MAQNCPAETGVIAANTTATRQKNAINFRAEIIDFNPTISMVHRGQWRMGASYPFRCGNNALNAADEDDRINS
jgi:hypothetical protein